MNNDPPSHNSNLTSYRYLVLDGTFLHRPASLITIMDAKTNTVIGGQYGVSESSVRQLKAFLEPLAARGLNPTSCTVDGNPFAIQALRTLWPDIIMQRCLVHVQQQGLMWCRRYPKTIYARKLRDIFLKVAYIRTKDEKDKLLRLIYQWEERYAHLFESQLGRGKVFSDVKRARSMLINALPDMFHYLDDLNISFSTNGLEGYFSRLKSHYRQHRGLRKTKLTKYIDWYLFLSPR